MEKNAEIRLQTCCKEIELFSCRWVHRLTAACFPRYTGPFRRRACRQLSKKGTMETA